MLKETNMEMIKNVTNAFLETDIEEIEGINPLIMVQHPFTQNSTWIKSKNFETINLLTDEGFKEFKEYVKSNIIDVAERPIYLLDFITKPYKSNYLYYILKYLNEEDLGELLRDVWKSCDYVNVDYSFSKPEYIKLFRSVNKKYLMDEKELEIFNNLLNSDRLTLYRGTNTQTNHPVYEALSWTTDFETAKKFAIRFYNNSKKEVKYKIAEITLYKEEIKKNVICFFEDESEVVLDYRFLNSNRIKYPYFGTTSKLNLQ